ALLGDRHSRQDAAPAAARLPRRACLAPPSPLRERDAASSPPRLDHCARRRGLGLPGRRRRPGRAPPRSCRGRRHRPLLRARDVGNGRRALELPPPWRARDVGGSRRHALNRVLDIALAGAGLVLTSPLLAASALAVKLEDGGPVLYRQVRVGKDSEDFELLKLRTMVVGAEKMGAGYAVNEGDPRITGIGRVLRRLSLDELPQLWNVVRGDMSIVGPRPTLRYQVEQYD